MTTRRHATPNDIPVEYGTPAWRRLVERVWRKVRFAEGDGCWEWAGKRYRRTGYGRQVIAGRDFRAHRVTYEIVVGPIRAGWVVCHSCDNPACVRPSHLYAAKQKENVADMIAKGRAWWSLALSEYRRDALTERRHDREFAALAAEALDTGTGPSHTDAIRSPIAGSIGLDPSEGADPASGASLDAPGGASWDWWAA